MDETFITLSINKFLNENNYQVIQCIPPGGQGGINFTVKNKIIYQYSSSSFLGFSLATTVNGLIYLPECGLGTIPKETKKFEDIAINNINNKFNFNLKHPSIYGLQSKKILLEWYIYLITVQKKF